jgi:phosphoribosylformylglycinamidine synthase PurS subunit
VYKVSVYVTPKHGVVDPQGAVIERALPALGHSGVGNIRVGRYITLEMEGADPEAASAAVDDMCRRLLANPIIEDYRFEIRPVEAATGAGEGA